MPVIFKETLPLSSVYRTMTMLSPPVTDFFWLPLVTGVLLVTQVFLHTAGTGAGRQVSESSFPSLCPWEVKFSPGALVHSPRASFTAALGGFSAPVKPWEASVFFSDSGDLPFPRPSFCGVSTKDRRGIKMHLIKRTFQVQGTKSRQIAGQGRRGTSFCRCPERAHV